MIVCGVDEAGRGPMFGPLVVAGVAIERSKLSKLRRLGIRDSKKLSPARREQLYSAIIKIADAYTVSRIQPHTVDKSVFKHKLNELEAKSMGRIISRLSADVAYVDACDVNAARFGRNVAKIAAEYNCSLLAGLSFFESLIPSLRSLLNFERSMATPATTRGPNIGPLPASSTPQTIMK